MAPSAEREGATCPVCLDTLESGSGVISLSPCGHILHRACFEDCAAAARDGTPRCPMCRGSVVEERIRTASAVPGARLANGAGYAQYAPRSVLPQLPQLPAAPVLYDASDAPAATNIPAGARDLLLAGISEQLGAGSPAPVSGAPTSAPSTWCFCIDVSSSMGSTQDWQPGAVSRLCFALASLACVVEAKVTPGDWVTVQAFDADQATLKRWFRRPATFDKAAFVAELTGAVRQCGLGRYGTGTCAAVEVAVETLASKANSLAAPADVGAAPAELGAAHSLVLLTDGHADDEWNWFDAAAALLRDPPFVAGGFKALLLHIADTGRSSGCLTRLAADADGAPLENVQVTRLQMGASLDLTPLPTRAATPAGGGRSNGGAAADRDWRSVRAFGDGFADFTRSPMSFRPRSPRTAPGYAAAAAARRDNNGRFLPTAPAYSDDA